MPLTIPLPRYFSIPSLVVGGLRFERSALNCRPCSLSRNQRPSAVSHSPALTEGSEPITVTRSRCPLTLTRSTANPVSSLKKVTRSIRPERLSSGVGEGFCKTSVGKALFVFGQRLIDRFGRPKQGDDAEEVSRGEDHRGQAETRNGRQSLQGTGQGA